LNGFQINMIDILIPTFNREPFLIKNIHLLDEQAKSQNITKSFRILVSNNCSTDNTKTALIEIKEKIEIELVLFEQEKNIGLEKNAIFLLEKSDAPFIIYLGDDDFLPNDYLSFVVEKIRLDKNLSVIIPGFSNLYSDGSISPSRNANFETRKFVPSLNSAIRLSNFGHQLSGLVLKRDRLLDIYTANEKLRNIYPFIFFVTFNNIRGNSYYSPKHQVLVSQGNSKDWRYDESGLLTEILKNYTIALPNSLIKRLLLSIAFTKQQSWRLQIGLRPNNIKKSVLAYLHLCKNDSVDLAYKATLPILYSYIYAKLIAVGIKNRLKRVTQ